MGKTTHTLSGIAAAGIIAAILLVGCTLIERDEKDRVKAIWMGRAKMDEKGNVVEIESKFWPEHIVPGSEAK